MSERPPGMSSLDQHFSDNQQHLRYKLAFLNGIFLTAALLALGLGFFRWQPSPVLAAFDFGFALIAFALLYYLRGHPEKVELAGSIALVLAFILFFAIFMLAPYQTNRLSLFFLLSAAAFFLKGIRAGLIWLAIIIIVIVVTHFMPGVSTGFSTLDIATTCLYLGALFFIFWHYETLKEDQYRREREHGLQRLIDESTRQALAEERGLFQAILENAPLGIWMVDAKGKVQFVNRGFCNSTGIEVSQFLAASHYADVMPPSVAKGCIRSDQESCAQATPHVSMESLPFVDGRDHLLEITKVRLLNKDGSIRGIVGLAADVTERVEHQRQLEHIAHYDALTGVPNRALLADRLVQALARAKRERGLTAVCYVDLDGFKQINDGFGHDAGDKVLVEVTRRIKEAVREDDTVARLGGDEFVVLLVGLQAAEECVGSLQRMLESINQPIAVRGAVLNISASIGVALYPEDEEDADTLLRHADQAMYVAKQSGKNRYHLFDAASDLRARSHHELLLQMRHGLTCGEFELYYQPKVAMDTRCLVGAEALIRWNHPQRGHLLPAEFLHMVESTELEIELGDWVVSTALEQLRQWRLDGFEIDLSINISAYHLQSKAFVQKLKDSAGLLGAIDCLRRLQIEVLETAALEDITRIGALIADCRALGVGFALDDFGTGYSSLTYLSKLDVDTLKIDQSFVRDMLEDKGDHAVVHGIIALARAFDMSIVAEGVETEAHYQALFQMGCETGQGFGIAYPMPAHELVHWRSQRQSAELF
jgi:diguanylate cyclase (GGDEF)-like protein/PAS domain S-box-containing protein